MNGRLGAARFYVSQVHRQFRQPAFFGKAISSRIVLSSRNWKVCLTLADYVTTTALRKLAARFSSIRPPRVSLRGPIMAIHVIRLGRAWPGNQSVEAWSVLNCRPREDWVGMEAEPPVQGEHPLLNQPPNTLSFENARPDSIPIWVPYDSIMKVEKQDRRVLVTLGPAAPLRWEGVVEITTDNERRAARLAGDIRRRQVRRIRCNRAVCRFNMLPRAATDELACQFPQSFIPKDMKAAA